MKNAWTWIKANKGLVARIIAIILVAINQILAAVGAIHTGASDDQIYMIVSSGVTIVTAGLAAWKNFNFSNAAVVAQKVLDAVKDGKITVDEVNNILDSVETAVSPTDASGTEGAQS